MSKKIEGASCAQCGRTLAQPGTLCPHCGYDNRQPAKPAGNSKLPGLLIAALAVLLVVAVMVWGPWLPWNDHDEIALPTDTPAVEPTEAPIAAADIPEPEIIDTSTPAPTEVPTPEPTAAPTPEPTITPVPTPKIGGTLMAAPGSSSGSPVFGHPSIRRHQIQTISFLSDLSGKPDDAWDVSADQDGAVWAWVTPVDDEFYDLFIASDGIIMLNADSNKLFYDYSQLTAMHFNGNIDTSCVTDMSWMFEGCNSLSELDVSGFDTSCVTDMSWMFNGCHSLSELDVFGFDTSCVTRMVGMFCNCHNLTILDLSGFDTSNVINMSHMFSNCSSLTELNVSGFDTSKVTEMDHMFFHCNSLTVLDLSSFDTSGHPNMYQMIPSQLREIRISDRFVLWERVSDPFKYGEYIHSIDDCTLVD